MIAFVIVSVSLVASALFTITTRKPVYSVIGLLVNFVALAMLYLALSAEFLAFIQILVYSGAILILFVFVIALLSSGVGSINLSPDRLSKLRVPGVIAAAAALGIVLWATMTLPFDPTPRADATLGVTGAAGVFGSVADFGRALFTTDLLPFEVTAFILLVAIVGVVLLAGDGPPPGIVPRPRRRRRSAEREPIARVRP